MLTKVCTKCGIEKNVDRYSKQTKGRLGVRADCKDCEAARMKLYYESNREASSSRTKQWYEQNKEVATIYRKAYYKNNKKSISVSQSLYRKANHKDVYARIRQWQQHNPDKVNAIIAKRRARKMQATPAWADEETIDSMYKLAMLFNRTGINLHVDHVVPLQSDLVCGLHCEANLQLLPASDNQSKGNRWWPDMW